MAAAKVFLSYAHEDDAHRAALVDHLTPLIDAGVLEVWHDRRIRPGADWSTEIDTNLENADLVLLLVSRYFMASDYCKGVEVKRALERRAQGLTKVVPVILSSCHWTRSPIGKLQALPTDGKPITEAVHPDQLYTAVVEGLDRLLKPRPPTSPQRQQLLSPEPLPPPLPWWRRPLPASLALGTLVLLLGGMTAGWLEQVRAGVRDDLRVDRADLAAERLGRVPEALRMAWPRLAGLDEVITLHRAGQQSPDDVSRNAQTLRRLLKERPDDAALLYLEAREAFGTAVRTTSLDELARAEALATRAVSNDPAHAAALGLRGLVEDVRGEHIKAELQYRAAAEQAPDEPQFTANHARALLDTGRAAEALPRFQRVSQRYTLAAVEQALAHWALGQWDAALESQTHAVERLRQPSLSGVPAEGYVWTFFPAPGEVVSLGGAERRCYAALGREVTRALRGEAGARATPEDCAGSGFLDTVRRLVDADVCRYALPALAGAQRADLAGEVRRSVLGQAGECAVLPVASSV